MIEVEVLVTVQVCHVQDPTMLTKGVANESAKEAIHNAVTEADDRGFSHSHADSVSVGVVDVEIPDAKPNRIADASYAMKVQARFAERLLARIEEFIEHRKTEAKPGNVTFEQVVEVGRVGSQLQEIADRFGC